MKNYLLPLFLSIIFCSCQSEYQERLLEARKIKAELESIKKEEAMIHHSMQSEILELEARIFLYAKISGNERLFLKELFQN